MQKKGFYNPFFLFLPVKKSLTFWQKLFFIVAFSSGVAVTCLSLSSFFKVSFANSKLDVVCPWIIGLGAFCCIGLIPLLGKSKLSEYTSSVKELTFAWGWLLLANSTSLVFGIATGSGFGPWVSE